MKVRRPWAAALALSMALGLAACGGEGANAPTPPAEVTAETTARPSVAPTAAPTPEHTVEATAQPTAQPVELREYTLTEIDLPEGWRPAVDSNNVAAGWVAIERTESGRAVEAAIYRASDGAILDLDGYWVFGGDGPMSRGATTRCLMVKSDLWNVFDVEQGKLLLETPVPDGAEDFWARLAPCFPAETWPQPKKDEATGLWGYVDQAGSWVLPPQYYDHPTHFKDGMAVVDLTEYDLAKGSLCNAIDVTGKELLPRRYKDLFYLGDGMFNYWGDNFQDNQWWTDCGLVSKDGVEYPTQAFSTWFNGGLTANYGLVAMTIYGSETYDDAYFDYAGNQVSEPFDWAGPIGDDGAGFVCKDDRLYRIQF